MLIFDPVTGQWYPASSVPVPGTIRLTVVVNPNGGDDGGTQRSERGQAVEALWRVAQAMVSSQALSGSVKDRNGFTAANWNYTPTASS